MITQTGTIQTVPLEQSLPPALCYDERIVALAAAVAKQLRKHAELIPVVIGIFYRLGELDETMLDILAGDMHVDWYDYNGTVEEKRKLIRNNVAIHRGMGTVAELRDVIESLHGDCAIEEWFEYGGEPYHFRVSLDIVDAEQAIDQRRIIEAVKMYKPVRAHLEDEALAYRGTTDLCLSVSAGYAVFGLEDIGSEMMGGE